MLTAVPAGIAGLKLIVSQKNGLGFDLIPLDYSQYLIEKEVSITSLSGTSIYCFIYSFTVLLISRCNSVQADSGCLL